MGCGVTRVVRTQIHVYKAQPSGALELVQYYQDPNVRRRVWLVHAAGVAMLTARVLAGTQAQEDYFTSAWAPCHDDASQALLCVAGGVGTIRIINTATGENRVGAGCLWWWCGGLRLTVAIVVVSQHLVGHGGPVNHLQRHPTDDHFMVSCSRDETVRFWNLQTLTCVAILGGDKGHRQDVLHFVRVAVRRSSPVAATLVFTCSVHQDVHLTGMLLASCGIDNTVKLWALDSERMRHAFKSSYHHDSLSSRPFETVTVCEPTFTTSKVQLVACHLPAALLDCRVHPMFAWSCN